MERLVKIIGILKWLSFIPGYIMMVCTEASFGQDVSAVLGVLATVSFWILMGRERSRIIGQTIAGEIKEAISSAANVDSYIEIKRLRSGILARVYLIDAKEKMALIHRAVTNRMENCSMRKYLWIMQMTDMPGKNALQETQKLLNEQLLEELLVKRRGDKK